MSSRGPALGILELSSIARGIVAIDAALKRSPAILVMSRPLSSGKHLACFEGGVAEVQEAMAAGKLAAGKLLLDVVELAMADAQVWPMLGEPSPSDRLAPTSEPGRRGLEVDWSAADGDADSVAIVETTTVCAAIRAADAAAKIADIMVRDVRLAFDLGGKAYFTMTGSLDSIEAAAAAGSEAAIAGIPGASALVLLEVIAQPSPDLRGRLIR